MAITSLDFFNMLETPSFILCNPNKEKLMAMGGISERVYSPRFNAFSELTFRADEYVNGVLMEYYKYLVSHRVVFVEELGYFTIIAVEETSDGIIKYKTITCHSLEAELMDKKISLFKETSIQLYNPSSASPTLLEKIVAYVPGWTVGTVDPDIALKYRSFDVSDKTLYEFLMSDVEKAYECVFSYNTFNRVISACAVANATTPTNIYISYDNLIKNMKVQEVTDNLATALTVIGGADLDINQVNPLGTNIIYNFDYFKNENWMTGSLVTAITDWEAVVDSNQVQFANYLSDLLITNGSLVNSETNLQTLNAELSALEITRSAYVKSGSPIVAITAEITAKQAEIAVETAAIAVYTEWVAEITGSIVDINETVSFANNFTDDELAELQPFIIQSSYINDNFIQTDIMSASSIQAQAQELYNQGQTVLEKLSEPRYSFELESVNFLALSEFTSFAEEVALGATVSIEVSVDSGSPTLVQPVLLGLDLNYDSPTEFKLMFGNRLRLDDSAFQYGDIMNSALNGGTPTTLNSASWNSWAQNYKNVVRNFIASPILAGSNSVISGSSNQIIMTDAGITGRTVSGSGFDPKQFMIVDNTIAVTEDNWQTSRIVVGDYTTSSGSGYGIPAAISRLDDLSDVSAPSPVQGDSIVYNATTGSYVNMKIDPTELAGDLIVLWGTDTTNYAASSRGAVAYASSEYIWWEPTFKAGRAIDTNDATYWASVSLSGGEWWYVDLQFAITVERFRILGDGATKYIIQYSDDHIDWTTCYTTTAYNADFTGTFSTPITARYFQVKFFDYAGGGGSFGIMSFELYGPAGEHTLIPLHASPNIGWVLGIGSDGFPSYITPSITAHKTTHENGGTDEISASGLSGLLADPQTPLDHASTHGVGGTDEISGNVAIALQNLNNIDITGLSDGYAIIYNNSTSKWEVGRFPVYAPFRDTFAVSGSSSTPHYSLTGVSASSCLSVYYNGVRILDQDITVDGDLAGFTLGFDVYDGDYVLAEYLTGATVVPPAGGDTLTFPLTRIWSSNKADGIFGYLATNGGIRTWVNPAIGGAWSSAYYTATQSSTLSGRVASQATDGLTAGTDTNSACTEDIASSWWKADFGTTYQIKPTYLGLIGWASDGYHPRNWKVQGSNDNVGWDDLLTVSASGPGNQTWYSSAISTETYYQYIRILNTGVNSSGYNHLVFAEIEIWGTMEEVV